MIKNFSDKDFRIFVLLFLFGVSFLMTLPSVTSALFGYSFGFNNNFLSVMFVCAIGYYICGYYISTREITKGQNLISIILFITITIVGALYLFYCYKKVGATNDFLMEYYYIVVSIASVCMFISFKYYFSKTAKNNIFTKLITIASLSSFGVYLFHEPFIGILHDYLLIGLYDFSPLLGVIVSVMIIFVFLVIVFYFVRKIPILKKIF